MFPKKMDRSRPRRLVLLRRLQLVVTAIFSMVSWVLWMDAVYEMGLLVRPIPRPTESSYDGGNIIIQNLQQPSAYSSDTSTGTTTSLDEQRDFFRSLNLNIRPYSPWNTTLPCFPLEPNWRDDVVQKNGTDTGILFVKVPKCGSSTGSSVTLRIAATIAAKQQQKLCKNRVQHSKAQVMNYLHRNQNESFLWSLVRDPTSRIISHFYHIQVARRGFPATDDSLKEFINTSSVQTFLENWLLLETKSSHLKRIQQLFDHYNLIGVTERFDETVVVLQMLLGLDETAVVYLKRKQSGGYDGGHHNGQCYRIPKSQVSTNMQAYFQSEEWKDLIFWDNVIHRAANYALDLTIESLGRDRFERHLAKFQKLQQKIRATCSETVRLPCTDKGERIPDSETDCLYNDMGCGFECFDRLAVTMTS